MNVFTWNDSAVGEDILTSITAPTTTFRGNGMPLSIYLKLEDGQQADFEILARSAISLIEALKDFANFADPSLNLKMTIQNGEEGSLRLNTIIKFITDRDEESIRQRQDALRWAIGGAAFFLLQTTSTHYFEKILDYVDSSVIEAVNEGGDPEKVQATAEECKKILEGALKNDVGARHVRRFYEEIREDPNVLGVGIVPNHEDFPDIIVPRDSFLELSRTPEPQKEETKRSHIERVQVLLVQPRLLGDDRAWRFSIGGMEFGAKVIDKSFIENTLSGKNQIPLVEGVYLDVDLRIDEQKNGDVWITKSRTVQHVHGVQGGKVQGLLFRPIE